MACSLVFLVGPLDGSVVSGRALVVPARASCRPLSFPVLFVRGVRLSGAGAQGGGWSGGQRRCRWRVQPGAVRPGGAACSAGGLVAALSGAPGAGSAWALAEGLESGAAAGWDCLERRVRVFAAQERLAGWLTYGRLVEAARWVRDWQAHPPIAVASRTSRATSRSRLSLRSGCAGSDGGAAGGRGRGYERRAIGVFGYPGHRTAVGRGAGRRAGGQ